MHKWHSDLEQASWKDLSSQVKFSFSDPFQSTKKQLICILTAKKSTAYDQLTFSVWIKAKTLRTTEPALAIK